MGDFSKPDLRGVFSFFSMMALSISRANKKWRQIEFLRKTVVGHLTVAPYSFMTARALMMRAVVICACSHKIVGFS